MKTSIGYVTTEPLDSVKVSLAGENRSRATKSCCAMGSFLSQKRCERMIGLRT